MKTKELKKKLEEMTPDELGTMQRNSAEELFRLRIQLAAGQLEDKTKLRQLKRNIARMKTIIHEKKIGTFTTKRGLKKHGVN